MGIRKYHIYITDQENIRSRIHNGEDASMARVRRRIILHAGNGETYNPETRNHDMV